jgi:SET domain-containing protein
MRLSCIHISGTEAKGRGVFTERFIEAETIIEVAPVIMIPASQKEFIDKTVLYDYYFNWSEDDEVIAIALGFASIYNHSYEPNCRYLTYYEDQKIEIITLRDIQPGEELTFNYNWEPEDRTQLWFNVIK